MSSEAKEKDQCGNDANRMLAHVIDKPLHVKPNFYSYCFEPMKIIALKYGYNLVLHGSLNRDMDLIAIPWQKTIGNVDDMINEFADYLDGEVLPETVKERACFPHGRLGYVINMNRGGYDRTGNYVQDKQFYIDISVTPIG